MFFNFNPIDFNLLGFVPNLLSQFDGGVGHIVAATLQTKGIIDQAKILQNLTELNSIASLFYLFAIAMAVGSIAVFGNYRQGIYLLVGPALYTFMVTTTVSTNGVRAKMGDYEIPNSVGRQTAFLQHIRTIDGGGEKQVSLAYALIDGIATEVVQEVTKVLVDTQNRDHLRFVAREKALSALLLDLPTDGPLPTLVSRHQAECSYAIRNYMQSGFDTKRILNSISKARSDADVAKIKAEGDKMWGDKMMKLGSGADVEIKRYLIAMSKEPGFGNVGIADPNQELMASCKDVWLWIGASFKLKAEKALEEHYKYGRKEKESDEPPVSGDVADAMPAPVLAAHMLKNTISQSSHSQLQASMFSNSPILAEDLSTAYEHHPGAHARGGYFGMKYFANSIPYLQGLLLYLLSIGFPFFAILLVIPGKAMNFMMWVSLWVWVKSWDVGFALVLVCKDMFWNILKHRNNTFDTNSIDWSDPDSVFAVILNNDPLATQNLYFELSAFLTVSVPFLTAHFCLGATGMFEMFRNSIDQTSQRFRTWEQKSASRERLNLVEREHPQLAAAVNELVADMAQNMNSSGMLLNGKFMPGRGAQDMRGRAIGRDTREAFFDGSNWGKVAGASNLHTMTAYNFSDVMVRLGNDSYRGQISKEFSAIDRLESDVNRGLSDTAEVYQIPSAFSHVGPTKNPNKTTLDEIVPAEVLGKYKETKPDTNIDVGKSITWGDFFSQSARELNQRLILPHHFRGMPRLEATVSIDQLRQLDKASGNLEMVPGGSAIKDLIRKAEQSQKENPNSPLQVSLGDVIEAGNRDFDKLVSYTGALSTRHYAPQLQEAFGSMNEAINNSVMISGYGRVWESGSGGSNEIFSNPAMLEVVEVFTGADLEDSVIRPGVAGEVKSQ